MSDSDQRQHVTPIDGYDDADLLRVILDTAVDGVLTVDERGRILTANRAVQRLYGYGDDELLGADARVLMSDGERRRQDAALERFRLTGRPSASDLGWEDIAVRKDGSTFPVHFSVGRASVGGEAVYVAVIRDITCRRAALTMERERDALRDAHRRFVPHELLELLGRERIDDLDLGDSVHRDVTVLFADIVSFTAESERMTARETFRFVNRYLAAVGPIIRASGGYIDKYIGDAIMAIFPGRVDDALEAAVGMKRRVRQLNGAREQDWPSIRIGVGVHSGAAVLGIVGERERLEGTVISDAVNVASRLERLTRRFGVDIIVSEQTLLACAEPERFARRFLGPVEVDGKSERVAVHEIFEGDDPELVEAKRRAREPFERGAHCLVEGDPAGAISHLRAALGEMPHDQATRCLMREAASLLQRRLDVCEKR